MGTKGEKSPEEGLTGAEDLTIELPDRVTRVSLYHRLD